MSIAWLKPAILRDDLEVVGLIDLDEASAIKRRDEVGLTQAKTGTDLEAMIAELKPDIIFDCTIPKAHVHVTLTALKHGCHVLGEKPMTESLADAKSMIAGAEKAGRLYAVIQNYRYNAPVQALKKFLSSGKLGRLTTVNADFYVGPHFGGFREKMRHVLLLDMAIHTFDASRYLSGSNAKSVYCQEWNPAGSWFDHGASATALFEMDHGVMFNYRGSWCAEGRATHWNSQWRIIGEKGTVTWDGGDDIRAQIVTKSEGFMSEWESITVDVPKDPTPTGHALIIGEFLDCLRSGGKPQTVCTDNVNSLAMVLAAVESAETGKRVAIEV